MRPLSIRFYQIIGTLSKPLNKYKRRKFDPLKMNCVLINAIGSWVGWGNIVQITPLVMALKDVNPEIEITILLSKKNTNTIIKCFPYPVSLIEMPSDHEYRQFNYIRFAVNVIRSNKYDLIISSFLQSWLSIFPFALFGKGKYTISYAYTSEFVENNLTTFILTNEEAPRMTTFAYNKQLKEVLGYRNSWIGSLKNLTNIKIGIEDKICNTVRDHEEVILGIHPGSGKLQSFKRWPPERFAEVASMFSTKYNGKILIFSGPDEVDESIIIENKIGKEKSILVSNSDPIITLNLIEKCDVFLSNDSALMNIAASLNVPTLGICCVGDAKRLEKIYPGNRFIQSASGVNCKPCYGTEGHLCCPSGKTGFAECLNLLTVEQVYFELEKLYSQSKPVRKL